MRILNSDPIGWIKGCRFVTPLNRNKKSTDGLSNRGVFLFVKDGTRDSFNPTDSGHSTPALATGFLHERSHGVCDRVRRKFFQPSYIYEA